MFKGGSGLFIKESFKDVKVQGSFLPSTQFLGRGILKCVEMKEGITIVELGAGTGALTKKILPCLPEDGRLIIVELNGSLADYLKKIFIDKRVTIVQGDAQNLRKILFGLGVEKVDCIISGIPLGNLSYAEKQNIFMEINRSLLDDGQYVQFQYFLSSWFHVKKIFKARIARYELRNFPPAFIYECRKKYI